MKFPLAGTSGIQNNVFTFGNLDLSLLRGQGATEKKKEKKRQEHIKMEKGKETERRSKRGEANGLL